MALAGRESDVVNAGGGCVRLCGDGMGGDWCGALHVPGGRVEEVFYAGFLAVYLTDPTLVSHCI